MKKIIVAGAGHGGITAAYNLAKSGYDVTVVEKTSYSSAGHDWDDSLDFSAFRESGMNIPDKDIFMPLLPQGILSPNGEVKLEPTFGEGGYTVSRKALVTYLIDEAIGSGVKFLFEKEILSPVCDEKKVLGIRYKDAEGTYDIYGDIVIDACGIYSPIRRNLPSHFGIQKEIEEKDIFYTYRAYYDNPTDERLSPSYNIYLFHQNKPGINWFTTEEKRIDVLVGKFGFSGRLTENEVKNALADFKRKYPFMGDKIIKGGTYCQIPLRRMLPKIVCNGYAAVGDSASMTVPLNGCGINLSMKAGKILADTIISAGNKELTTENLWKYQYNYYTKYGKDLVIIDILKSYFKNIGAKDVEYVMKAGILDAQLVAFVNEIIISKDYIRNLIKKSGPLLRFIPSVAVHFKYLPFLNKIHTLLPEHYDEVAFKKWEKHYNKLT